MEGLQGGRECGREPISGKEEIFSSFAKAIERDRQIVPIIHIANNNRVKELAEERQCTVVVRSAEILIRRKREGERKKGEGRGERRHNDDKGRRRERDGKEKEEEKEREREVPSDVSDHHRLQVSRVCAINNIQNIIPQICIIDRFALLQNTILRDAIFA